MNTIILNGAVREVHIGQSLIEAINQPGVQLPPVCYHPQLGPIWFESPNDNIMEIDKGFPFEPGLSTRHGGAKHDGGGVRSELVRGQRTKEKPAALR